MKQLFFFLILIAISLEVVAQPFTYTSPSNSSGLWLDEDNWTDPPVWAPQTPSDNANADLIHSNVGTIEVYGYIYKDGGLTFSTSTVINVFDTLVISGNLDMNQGSITVAAGAVLVIDGDVTLTNGAFNLGNAGNVIITGNLSVTNGNVTNSDNLYIFGSTTVNPGGGGTVGGCNAYSGCDPVADAGIEDAADLSANDPDLDTFLASTGTAPLPIELLSFGAYRFDHEVILRWVTATETNNDFFSVERSVDGRNFEIIETMDGAGNSFSELDYSFTDQPLLNGIIYYRLKQTDFDNQFSYSSVISIHLAERVISPPKLYPVPAKGILNIDLSNIVYQNVFIKVYDIKGNETYSNEFENRNKVYIDLRDRQKGIYSIIIKADTQVFKDKFVLE